MAKLAATVVALPRDAIFDILSWTPVRSVCRFRCVSKEWLSGISTPAFIAQHRSRAGSEPLVVAGYDGKPDGILVMDMKGNVLRTIEGLGTIRNFCSNLDNFITVRCADSIHVIDVTTGKKVLVIPSESDECYYHTIRLGRAAVSGSYKVVCIGERRDVHQNCEVITLRDGAKWKRAQPPPVLVCLPELYGSGSSVDGALYFLSDSNNVLRFDLESEKWSRTIRAPQEANIDLPTWIGEIPATKLNDALCMIQTKVKVALILHLSNLARGCVASVRYLCLDKHGCDEADQTHLRQNWYL
ncbi:hypothetical protein D1007_60323 [Hordeum vulgare]|nr:hypothetical protein D1007_60323 [Hordeum vulgare]